jgi:hypothetical protein
MIAVPDRARERGPQVWSSIVALSGAILGSWLVCVGYDTNRLWSEGPLMDLIVSLIVLPPILLAVVLVDLACSYIRKAPLWLDTNPFWKGIAIGVATAVLDRRLHILAPFDGLFRAILR